MLPMARSMTDGFMDGALSAIDLVGPPRQRKGRAAEATRRHWRAAGAHLWYGVRHADPDARRKVEHRGATSR